MNWLEWEPQEQILTTVQEILQEALAPDSEIQKNVQEKLNVIQGMSDFTNYLFYILCENRFTEDERSLSAILLKSNLTSIYGRLPDDLIYKIRSECLRLLKDPSRKVRSSISNIIVIICKDNLKTWPDLLPQLLKIFYEQNEYSDTALNTLFKICEELIHCHKTQEELYRVIKEVFPKFLDYISDENCNCRLDIVRLTNQFLQDYFQIMKQSIDLDTYLRKIIYLTNSDDIELLKHICHTFAIYMDNQEPSLLPHLHDVILYLLEKCQHEDADVALQACEFWLSTAKLNNCKDILMPYIDKLLPILLNNMKYSAGELHEIKGTTGIDAELVDDAKDIYPGLKPGMVNRSMEDEDDEEDMYDFERDFDDFSMGWTLRKCSAASLDSIAVKFGDDLLILLIPLLNDILNSGNFLVKESAILALGAIAKGCLNGLKPHLPYLIEYLITAMNDDHSLVRVITCWTLSRYVNWIMMLNDTSDLYFLPVMTVLLKHFVDDNKKVQRAAISAFCTFQEEAGLKLIPYIDFILDGFHLGFQKFHYRSLYLLYDAIGILAQSVGNQLNKEEYVRKLLPPLMEKFLQSDNYFDDHFVAVMECLANLIPALETSFLPYAEIVYCNCLQLINDTLLATIRNCPVELISPLIKIIIDEVRKDAKKQPVNYGFNQNENAYEPLKLMKSVVAKTNEILQRYLDNSKLCSLPSPCGRTYSITSAFATKNLRRTMEDRHVVIHDLNTLFNKQEASPSSYYAIFDGHAGYHAAAYCATHLHQFLAESPHFISNPEKALYDAFCETDQLFLNKCKTENFASGTTAVCALLRPKEKYLYIAWVGDSQAVLVTNGKSQQCVDPHKPNRSDERQRIIEQGGSVLMLSGTWRVNGLLAVSRAIGDAGYKPHVTGIPEIKTIALDGNEDFLILACDGLWDFMTEDEAARIVYLSLLEHQDNLDEISKKLAQTAKVNGSSDNISLIIVFLRDPSKIAEKVAQRGSALTMDATLDNNPFTNSNGASGDSIIADGDLFMENFKKLEASTECSTISPQSNNKFHEFLTETTPPTDNNDMKGNDLIKDRFNVHDMDLGPETDVDTCDDVDLRVNLMDVMETNSCSKEIEAFLQEKGALELGKQIEDREETPTPPVKDVHDVSGLIEATGCDSESEEDEWKFLTGDEADKQNLEKIQQQKDSAAEEEDDTMSQLNPNAAEFVPVSPVRGEPSPACAAIIFNDQVIAQSPSKGAITQDLVDINIPDEIEFEKEVKSRPSELFNDENEEITTAIIEPEPKSNGVVEEDSENGLLNGKTIKEKNDIPDGSVGVDSVPNRMDEFHFGPNATPFSPSKLLEQCESQSTTAVFGDSTINDGDFVLDVGEISLNKVEDPMSMSFYQEKDERGENAFLDLNQARMLPDDLDAFLQQSSEEKPAQLICNDVVKVTDLDEKKEKEEEKELESPQETLDVVKPVENVEHVEIAKDNDLLIDTKLTECDKLNFAQEISNATQEIIEMKQEIIENVPQSTNPFIEEKEMEKDLTPTAPIVENVMKEEIVVNEEPKLMNDFLDRTQVENMLSPIEQNDVAKVIDEQMVVIEKDIKLEPEIKVEEVKKTISSATAKKPNEESAKKSLTKVAATKPPPPKPRTTVPKSTTTTTTATKPATKLVPKPKPAPTTVTKQTAKPVNGDVKTTGTKQVIRKTVESTTKPQTTRTSLTQRTATKTTTDSGVTARTTLRRPATASGDLKATSSATTKTTLTATKVSPKPPMRKPLSSGTTTTGATAAAAAKPRVSTARQPLSKPTDTEKQLKESANKLTKTTTSTLKNGPRSTLTSAKRVEAKTTSGTSSSKTTVTKSTSVTKTTITKKPTNTISSTSGGKVGVKKTTTTTTTTTNATKEEKPKENGVNKQAEHIDNGVVEGDLLQKDNSPIDNKIVGELLVQTE